MAMVAYILVSWACWFLIAFCCGRRKPIRTTRGLQRDEASGLYDTESLSKVADQKLKAFKMVGSDVKITTMSLWQLKKL